MTHEEIITYCLKKPDAYPDHPFGPASTTLKVRGPNGASRIFAQIFTLRGEKKATFNCDLMTGEFYRSLYPGSVTRGYHCPPVQQPYFNTVALDGSIPDEEILCMIDHAYAVVTAKLSKKKKREANSK